MKRITSGFSNEICEKLEAYKQERGLATMAQCVGEIVELWLQKKEIGALAANDSFTKPSSTISPELTELLVIKKLLANNLAWTMESRLLSRQIVANLPKQPVEANLEILDKFKKRSQRFTQKNVSGYQSLLGGN